MPAGNGVSAPDLAAPLDRTAAREAARWLMRLGSGQATDDDVRALARWRASSAERERAWTRAQAVQQAFGTIPPGLGMATLGRPVKTRRALLKALAALIVAPPAALAAWRAAPLAEWTAAYRTATGQRRDVRLADGSLLRLNTATAVDTDFDAGTRALRLHSGEIYVEAAADASRPLVVHTPLGTVRARDAHFSVCLRDGRCRVGVATGEVALHPAAAAGPDVALAAPRQAWFDAHAVAPDTPADPRQLDWMRGMLHADAMRLDAFAAELARYRPGVVRCDPEVAGLRLSGAFQLDNTDGVLQALPALLPVRVRYVTAYWVTLGPAARA